MNRLDEDNVWMLMAEAAARRSKCVRSQVGCVIVSDDSRIVSTGYNGPPAGYGLASDLPCNNWCKRAQMDAEPGTAYTNCPSIHAEANALLHAARHEIIMATMFTTRHPCFECAKLIANSGIARVVYQESEDRAEDFYHARGLLVNSDVAVDRFRDT